MERRDGQRGGRGQWTGSGTKLEQPTILRKEGGGRGETAHCPPGVGAWHKDGPAFGFRGAG